MTGTRDGNRGVGGTQSRAAAWLAWSLCAFTLSVVTLAKTLAAFSARSREETELDPLTDDLAGVVREAMQPAYVAFWLRPPEGVGKVGGEKREQ